MPPLWQKLGQLSLYYASLNRDGLPLPARVGILCGDLEIRLGMTAQEYKDTGLKLASEKKYAEAQPLLQWAVKSFPADEMLWQHLAYCADQAGNRQEAIAFCKEGLHKHPRSWWLWETLGYNLLQIDLLDEAEKALQHATDFHSRSPALWRQWATLHRKQENYVREAEALEVLVGLDAASGHDLNLLGIAHYNQQPPNFAKALTYYGRAALLLKEPHIYRNIGLVYSLPEVSQDLDAGDAYRRSLLIMPDYELAKTSLAATKKKLIPLAECATDLSGKLLKPEERFQFYINPFEALNATKNFFPNPSVFSELTTDELYCEIDDKAIQRAQQKLLHEIKLEDGIIRWMDSASIDNARAIAICVELDTEEQRYYHWHIYRSSRLLRFLTRGDIRHFAYEEDFLPVETLDLMDEDPAFVEFFSLHFAKQYSLVLSRAIKRRLYPTVEALLSGRRWVLPQHEDECFAGAYKHVDELVRLIESKAQEAVKQKPNATEFEAFLRTHGFIQLFNLLPAAFRGTQTKVVAAVRDAAIACHNEHGDTDLSQAMLNLSKLFRFKNAELTQRLEEDFKTVQKLIAEQRKDECKLQFGKERKFEITKEGVLDAEKFFPASTVKAVRWGILISTNGTGETFDYLLSIRNDQNDTMTKSWKTAKATEAEQTRFFDSMVRATIEYLADHVIGKLQRRIRSGEIVQIGPCALSQAGVGFEMKGRLFKRKDFVPWQDFATKMSQGRLLASKQSDGTTFASISIRDIENAVLLPMLRVSFQAENTNDNKPPVANPGLKDHW